MKLIIYTRFLNFTSVLLNFCVHYHMWFYAEQLINFRKKHIARIMRRVVVKA